MLQTGGYLVHFKACKLRFFERYGIQYFGTETNPHIPQGLRWDTSPVIT